MRGGRVTLLMGAVAMALAATMAEPAGTTTVSLPARYSARNMRSKRTRMLTHTHLNAAEFQLPFFDSLLGALQRGNSVRYVTRYAVCKGDDGHVGSVNATGGGASPRPKHGLSSRIVSHNGVGAPHHALTKSTRGSTSTILASGRSHGSRSPRARCAAARAPSTRVAEGPLHTRLTCQHALTGEQLIENYQSPTGG